MVKTRNMAIVLLLIVATCASARADGLDNVVSAIDRQDYVTARAQLETLAGGVDPRVFRLLGELNFDGKGAPPDLIEAYKDFSLEGMYTSDPDERAGAFTIRRSVARKLSPEEIKEAERRVTNAVKQRLGEDEVIRQTKMISSDLAQCRSECEDQAARVFSLGPAASTLVPELESLMTRDIKWMPREYYAYALGYIGTAGVPALVRQLEDEDELRTEGFWNLQQSADVLGALGPTAFAARRPLLEAFTRPYDQFGEEHKELLNELTQEGPDEVILGIRTKVMSALVKIADPGQEIYKDLQNFLRKEENQRVRLLAAWGVGMLYEELEPGLTLIKDAMRQPDGQTLLLALGILGDFAYRPSFHQQMKPLLVEVSEIAVKGEPEVRSAAQSVLDNFARPSMLRGIEQLKSGSYEATMGSANEVLAINPMSEDAFLLRAQARRESGDIEGAVSDYLDALKQSEYPFWVGTALDRPEILESAPSPDSKEALRPELEKCVRNDECYKKLRLFE